MSSKFLINKAISIIRNDGLISYPTESVYGLGCNLHSEIAIKKLLHLKQRAIEKGLIIIADKLETLAPYIEITAEEKQKILDEKSAVTWLVRKSKHVPFWISGSHLKVAVRISQHPLVIKLCQTLNQPLVSTSANPSGAKPALTSLQSRRYFKNQIDIYLNDFTVSSSYPTKILDIESNEVIR